MKKALGFTLVEVSVVLVVIGIIMGMAVKGRDLVETSRLRQEIRKLDKFAATAAVIYAEEQAIPIDMRDRALRDGLLTDADLEVNSYFNNSQICLQNGCTWYFIRGVTIYDDNDNTSVYRLPAAADNETGDVLLAVAVRKNNANEYGYANSFVCKVEEYIDDKDFKGAMGLFFVNTTSLKTYKNTCSPSKNLLSGEKIDYGYKVL